MAIVIPTPRSTATQLPPQALGEAGAGTGTAKPVVVQAHLRAAPTPKPKPTPSPLAATLPGVDQEAANRANLAIQPGVQAAQAAAARDAQNTLAQNQLLSGFYQALGPLLRQIAPGVQAGYQQAAGTDAILGKAFGGQYDQADAGNAAQVANILQGQGAPAGQVQAAQTATGTPGLGNALGWLSAGLPAQSLTQAGAAYGAAARLLPGQVAQMGGQEIAQNTAIGRNQQAAQQAKIDALTARIPGLIETYAPSIARQDAAAQAAQVSAQAKIAALTGYDPVTGQPTPAYQKILADISNAQNTTKLRTAYDKAQIGLKQASLAATDAYRKGQLSISDYNATTSRIRARDTELKAAAAAAPKYSASNSRSLGYRADQYGNPLTRGGKAVLLPGFGYDKSGNIVKKSTARASTTHQHGLTQTQVNRVTGEALTIAQNAFQGVPAGSGSASWNLAHPQGLPKADYNQALLEMEQSGIPKWVAIPALNRFYPPGVNGRPLTPAQAKANKTAVGTAAGPGNIFGG